MKRTSLIAPYNLGLNDSGDIIDMNGKMFDVQSYSRMKYGVRSDVKRFAADITEELRQKAPQLFAGSKPPAFVTSYKAAATPATSLARYVLDSINLVRFAAGLAPGEMVQMYRPRDYIEEYAALPAEERQKLLDGQGENTLRGRNLDSFEVVIIDDIYITGAIANMMSAVLADYNPLMVFLAVGDDTMKNTPNAEKLLNLSDIQSPADLLPYIKRDDFIFSRRFLKMLIKSDPAELRQLVPNFPDRLREEISRAIIDTDSELGLLFPDACELLIQG